MLFLKKIRPPSSRWKQKVFTTPTFSCVQRQGKLVASSSSQKNLRREIFKGLKFIFSFSNIAMKRSKCSFSSSSLLLHCYTLVCLPSSRTEHRSFLTLVCGWQFWVLGEISSCMHTSTQVNKQSCLGIGLEKPQFVWVKTNHWNRGQLFGVFFFLHFFVAHNKGNQNQENLRWSQRSCRTSGFWMCCRDVWLNDKSATGACNSFHVPVHHKLKQCAPKRENTRIPKNVMTQQSEHETLMRSVLFWWTSVKWVANAENVQTGDNPQHLQSSGTTGTVGQMSRLLENTVLATFLHSSSQTPPKLNMIEFQILNCKCIGCSTSVHLYLVALELWMSDRACDTRFTSGAGTGKDATWPT